MSRSLPALLPVLLVLSTAFLNPSCAQPLNQKNRFTHQDSLRGSNGPGRDWWDARNYNIYATPDYKTKSINGWNEISFIATKGGNDKMMQIDLQEPMVIESISL